MKKITIYDYKNRDNETHNLFAEVKDNGDLVLSGYDCGQSVKNFFGDFDHEYWLKVNSENVPSILLYLIKERFKDDTELREWLDEKNIKFEFSSFT
ncbi:MAG: hypothetical protein ACFFB0_19405 [Promethearchaeota archaeon]